MNAITHVGHCVKTFHCSACNTDIVPGTPYKYMSYKSECLSFHESCEVPEDIVNGTRPKSGATATAPVPQTVPSGLQQELDEMKEKYAKLEQMMMELLTAPKQKVDVVDPVTGEVTKQ